MTVSLEESNQSYYQSNKLRVCFGERKYKPMRIFIWNYRLLVVLFKEIF